MDSQQLKVLAEGSNEINAIHEEKYEEYSENSNSGNGINRTANRVSGSRQNRTSQVTRGNKNVFKDPAEGINMLLSFASNPGVKMSEKARKKIFDMAEKQRNKNNG